MSLRFVRMTAIAVILVAGSGCAFVIRTGSALSLGCDSSLPFQSGDGSENNPYQICAPEHFANLGNTSGIYYKLTSDIDLAGVSQIASFSGTLVGNGKTISGYQNSVPLFDAGTNVTIENLTIEDFVITGGTGLPYGALFRVVTTGTFEDIVLQDLTATGVRRFGFLAGACTECIGGGITLSNSTASGTDTIGGIFSELENGTSRRTIKNITISGVSITTSGDAAGGFAASTGNATLVNVSVNADVECGNNCALLSGFLQNSEIIDVSTAGSLTGTSYCGGISGQIGGDSASLIQTSNSGTIECSSNYTGGLTGDVSSTAALITRSENTGTIICADQCGGIVGANAGTLMISNSRSTGTLTGGSGVAGIVGRDGGVTHMSHTISNATLSATGTLRGMIYATGTAPVVFESYYNETAAGTNSDDATSASFDTKKNPAGIIDAETYWSYNTDQFWNITDGALPTLKQRDFASTHTSCDPFRPRTGTGTLADPYIVCANIHLLAGLSGYMKLAQDISLVESGAWSALSAVALTQLDGDDYLITGLDASGGGTNSGLIDNIQPGTTIRNLHIQGASAEGASDSNAILVGAMNGGTIENCSVSGSVLNDGTEGSGGLTGLVLQGSIVDSKASIRSVTIGNSFGGAVGIVDSQTGAVSITRVSAKTKLTDPTNFSGNAIGGLVGVARASVGAVQINSSQSSGSILGNSSALDNLGGLIGSTQETGNSLTVSQCSSSTAVDGSTGGTNIGGLIGLLSAGTVTDSFAIGSVAGERKVGGLIGGMNSGAVSRAYSTGNTVCASTGGGSGGFIGRLDGGTITNAYATGNATGPAVGGFVGPLNGGSITHAYATGVVTISGGGTAGGFAESTSGGSFADCFFDVTTTTQATTAGTCTGLVTADMLLNATYAAWDLINIWNPPSGSAYPTLR